MKDIDYHFFSEKTYEIENGVLKKDEELGKYKIFALEDNQNNGMQAMAVAPVNARGEVDTSKIVIA